jgi:hypothetical protein
VNILHGPARFAAIADCRLPIADWNTEKRHRLFFQLAIGNRQSAIAFGIPPTRR